MPARMRSTTKKTTAKTAAPKELTFTPDPGHLLPLVGVATGPPASQRFRVQRPRDLVNLQISAYGCELVRDGGATLLRPVDAKARLEVRLPFQHLGEQSFVDEEPLGLPPIRARAAYGSRLVFGVPDGEAIEYSVEGVLAALSRLPLTVVPLAQPATGAKQPYQHVPLAELPGGYLLARNASGLE